MNPKRLLPAVFVVASALGVAGIASSANGDQPLTRPAALSVAAAKYPAFARPQAQNDIFRSRSADPANQRAAVDIARTSRRAFANDRGEAFVFLNNDNDVCVEWRPVDVGAAGASCTRVDSPNPPGVLVSSDGTMDNPVIVGMLPSNVSSVEISQADATTRDAAINDGVYVYQGRTPFEVRWRAADGRIMQSRTVEPLPTGPLKPNR